MADATWQVQYRDHRLEVSLINEAAYIYCGTTCVTGIHPFLQPTAPQWMVEEAVRQWFDNDSKGRRTLARLARAARQAAKSSPASTA